MKKEEKWLPVVSFPQKYEVSNDGRVRVVRTGKLKALRLSARGYLQTNISGSPVSVHRIVAEAFCPKRDGATEVNHINAKKTDNRAENLEFVTRAENMQHASASGLIGKKLLSEIQRAAIFELRAKFSASEIAAIFGVCRKTVVRIALHPKWRKAA